MKNSSKVPVTFLLIDDLEENLLALEALLRRDDLILLKARSGEEALELLLRHDIALALVDVHMPGMNGFELAEIMRGSERTRRVPIIFLTAGSTDQQRRFRGYDAGAVDFLTKPIEPHILRSKAEVFLELWLEKQEVARQRDELKAATEVNAQLLEETQRTADALKEAHRRKDEFLATLAHELRNPLAPILNGLQVMRVAGDDQETVLKAREMMDRQLKHMVRLVDDLLDISRITTGKVRLRLEPVDFHAAVEAAVEASRTLFEASSHTLSISLPKAPLLIDADATRVTQIIGNILTNAAKYTPDGGKIDLSAEVIDSSVVITIKDNGIGISPEMLPKVFDLFTQVGYSIEQSQGGLGIGLSLVRKLVELHGGEVFAFSEGPGHGSQFAVKLPIGDIKSKRVQAEKNTPSSEPSQRRILVVDDNFDGAESLSLILSFSGHETRMAHSGVEALSATEHFRPDLIFLDIGLPQMNGHEVAQAIRADQDKYGNPLLIALTGWGSAEDRRKSKEAGFDFHLTKPVENSQIEQILAERARAL